MDDILHWLKSQIGSIWLLSLAMLAGGVHYINKVRRNKHLFFSWSELIGELLSAGLVGIATIYLCRAVELNTAWTGFLVAIAGHISSRLLFILDARTEQIITMAIRKWFK